MKYNILETIIGFAVIIIAGLFFSHVYKIGNLNSTEDTYIVKAQFQNIDGINEGTDIMMAGIKIGDVKKLSLDKNSYMAILDFCLDSNVKLPKDSRFAVSTSGLLGGKYISVSPGGDEENLAAGDIVKNTQSSINLEELIGKLMYSMSK